MQIPYKKKAVSLQCLWKQLHSQFPPSICYEHLLIYFTGVLGCKASEFAECDIIFSGERIPILNCHFFL